jgi:hypothetical protein
MKACGRMATKFYYILNFGTGLGEWSALGTVSLISREWKKDKIGEEPEWEPNAFFSILEVRKFLACRKSNHYSVDNQPAAFSVPGENYLGSDTKLV